MPEFLNLVTPDDALRTLLGSVVPMVRRESVAVQDALGRVTAEDVTSPEDLPAFPRSTMDGFSVRAADTFGASEGLPAYLDIVGEVPMGSAQAVDLDSGQAAVAFTGGALAANADAVVMVELTQRVGDKAIEVLRPVAPGENVVPVGEDISTGDRVLPAGHLVRPQDVGGLSALGITSVIVVEKPTVAIVSTGDELVAPGSTPGAGQVRDINTSVISAMVTSSAGLPFAMGIIADEFDAQREAALQGLAAADALVFSAGSSVSSRDLTADVFRSLGEHGVLLHGISHKPGKPTIAGIVENKPVFGLPGNPVSAAVVFEMLVRPIIYRLAGCFAPPTPAAVTARLTRDVASQTGREDHVQVRLVHSNGRVEAEPVFGKSNLIYTLVRSDGSVTVPPEKGGLYAGEDVSVRLH